MGVVRFNRCRGYRDHPQLDHPRADHHRLVDAGCSILVTTLATANYAEAVGAYLISAAAFVLLGLSGYFDKLIRLIPPGVAAGLLAGILLQFGIAPSAA